MSDCLMMYLLLISCLFWVCTAYTERRRESEIKRPGVFQGTVS